MSIDTMDVEEPRRGSRQRKAVERFAPSAGNGNADADEDAQISDASDEDAPVNNGKRKAPGTSKAVKNQGRKVSKKKVVASDVPLDSDLMTDSALFTALLNPDIAMEPLIDDWVGSYQASAGKDTDERQAVAQIILLIIRACGLRVEVDEDEVIDIDGIQDVVERYETESQKTVAAVYPIVNKDKQFKHFKSSLGSAIDTLIKTLSQTPLLYHTTESTSHTTPIIPLIQAWLHTLSTSSLRSLRHTSTYLSLKLNSALCEVMADVVKDLSVKQRQKEAQAGRSKGGGGAAEQKRIKEAEKKVKEVHERKMVLEELLKEHFDVVFVHRVRDSDPNIRVDCLRELGEWIKSMPEKFVDRQYLSYLSKGCNDPDSHARLVAVRSLSQLYSSNNAPTNARTATLRLAPRLIEMALNDADTSVRIQTLSVLDKINQTGILQDEDSDEISKISKLIFDDDARIRKAVGSLVAGYWTERVENLTRENSAAVGNKKKRSAGISEDDMKNYLSWKALASLLIETSLNNESELDGKVVLNRDKTAAAVQALSASVELLQDHDGLIDYLLLDHSNYEQNVWLVDEDEESFLINVLLTIIASPVEDEIKTEQTVKLIDSFQKLLSKNTGNTPRLISILGLVQHMQLEAYLDNRKTSDYDHLWDDLIKLLTTSTHPSLLESTMKAIWTLNINISGANINTTKFSTLQDTLFENLRDQLDGEDVSLLSLEGEQIMNLQSALSRLQLLQRSKNVVDAVESNEGDQSTIWDIVCALIQRGELGFKEENTLLLHAMQIAFFHLSWLMKEASEGSGLSEERINNLKEKRQQAVELYKRLATQERSNTTDIVRRQACVCYINLYLLNVSRAKSLPTVLQDFHIGDDMQYRISGFFQADVERFATEVSEENIEAVKESDQLKRNQGFYQLCSVFVTAIRTGVLEVEHAKGPLIYYGRLGYSYDAIVRKLGDILRDEGIYNRQSETVQAVAVAALTSSFSAFLDELDSEKNDQNFTATLSLAKFLSTVFTIQGAHFTILKQLHPSDAYNFHSSAITYICKKIQGYTNQERGNKSSEAKSRFAQKRNQALLFFKPLLLLLGAVQGRDALKLKNDLESELEGTGSPVNNGKAWESCRIYERKLMNMASKDKGVKMASQRIVNGESSAIQKNGKSKKNVGNGGDGDAEEEGGGSGSDTDKDDDDQEKEVEEGAEPEIDIIQNDEEDIDLNLNEDEELDLDLGLDFENNEMIQDSQGHSQRVRNRKRSISIEPSVKRRKVAQEF